jgi:hypothetical protein
MKIQIEMSWDPQNGFVETESLVYVNTDGQEIILFQIREKLSLEMLTDPSRQEKESKISSLLQVRPAQDHK